MERREAVMSNENGPSQIVINGKTYSMINIINSHNELIASIDSENIIEAKGYRVELVKAND